MASVPETPPSGDKRETGGLPPPLPATPPNIAELPPRLASTHGRPQLESFLRIVLSLSLVFFAADALISFVDDTAVLLVGSHVILTLRVIVFLFATVVWILVYCLMGLTPMIPKRVFLVVTLFNPAIQLITIPCYIFWYAHNQLVTWLVSLLEVVVALGTICWIQGGLKWRWPLFPERLLIGKRFSWLNLSLFFPISVFVALPMGCIYLWLCATLAVDHFSDSFMKLRPDGFTVRVRTYTRPDGKSIELVPMSHIGEPEYYRELSQSFPSNALILMEGVTDNRNLLTNRITYRRMATSLGLTEQQKEFKPIPERIVRADVDVEEFAPSTIALLNVAMLIHSKGINADTLRQLLQYSPPPHFEDQLIEDLLRKRNRRLLQEVRSRLEDSQNLIVPWGVAHMPEIAREIQKSGFHLDQTREYVAIRFGSGGMQKRTMEKRTPGG
ncbi:MAG TPA: hypothetical protein VL361_16420 [Candidatus Limnocylindrales bacterium]|jgi:hypothetical protein|nr:hypothetical protein [Candidatus Limnocylindrales bacterium]